MDKIHQELYVHYQYDYHLYGLRAAVPEYKLAWHLNRTLQISLKKAPDLVLEEGVGASLLVSNFIFRKTHRTFRLLKNQAFTPKEIRAFLLPELMQWNYFLQIHDPSSSLDQRALLNNISTLSVIQQAVRIEVNSIEHKENLLF